MTQYRLFALIVVSVCMLVPLNSVNAKPSKDKPSHKRAHDDDHKNRHEKFHKKQREQHEKFHNKQRERHEKFHNKQRERHTDHHADDHDDDDDSDRDGKLHDKQQSRHEKFHEIQRERHEKFHDKQRARHDNHHADDHDEDGEDHADRYDRFHDKQRARHDDHHTRDRDDHHAGHSDREGHHPWNKQRLNEERKFQHQLDQADHLRQISERNGNPRLAEAADRMEQRALERYEKRLQKIDEHHRMYETRERLAEHDHSPDWQSDPDHSGPTTRSPKGGLSEFNDGFKRQLLGEQRDLRHRLDTADRLRQIGRRSGDQQLLEMADRVEGDALEGFDRRIQRLGKQFTPNQQAQLNDFVERSVTETQRREPDRMVSQSVEDRRNPILDQPVRYLWQDDHNWIGR